MIKAYKQYYNYSNLEQKLNQNGIVKQIIMNIKQEYKDFHEILNDKKISIIIKNNLWDINQQFINQNYFVNNTNIKEEPMIKQIEGNKKYQYYLSFELIEEELYEILFKNKKYSQKESYRECFFENNYIYFTLPGNLCNNKNHRNIEICILNTDNVFSANFIFKSNSSDSFNTFLKSTKQNGSFAACLDSFKNNNQIE